MNGSSRTRLPWEIVETFPSTDAALVAEWRRRRTGAAGTDRIRASVGLSLALYWAVQEGVDARGHDAVATERAELVHEAVAHARQHGDADVLAEALLGALYSQWGPDSLLERRPVLEELAERRESVTDTELRLRIDEWWVVDAFDRGDLDRARERIRRFRSEATDLVLFHRREELWRANLAMLTGELDRAVAINQEAIAATSAQAGTPFSFQNLAITMAIERFLRRGLADVVEAVRSIRASSPRVGSNWDVGLAFTLSEIGELDEARRVFDGVAEDDFAAVPRDLNWLPTMHLVALVALTLDDGEACRRVAELLAPFAAFDATHGSGYASYGPTARVLGLLAGRDGDHETATARFDHVLATRAPGPWTALTRLHRARLLVEDRPSLARAEASRAADELRRHGMAVRGTEADALVTELDLAGHGAPIATLADGRWTLRHRAGSAEIPDGAGIRHLVELLQRPGQALDVLVLEGTPAGLVDDDASESSLDHQARRSYQRRITALAPHADDPAAAEELTFLRRELAAGRYAPSTSAERERARVRVTKRIRRTVDRITEGSAGLGSHLSGAVRTGRSCSYDPTDGRPWRIVVRDG